MAMADSRHPVVEKVQQLPQEPWGGEEGKGTREGEALCGHLMEVGRPCPSLQDL